MSFDGRGQNRRPTTGSAVSVYYICEHPLQFFNWKVLALPSSQREDIVCAFFPNAKSCGGIFHIFLRNIFENFNVVEFRKATGRTPFSHLQVFLQFEIKENDHEKNRIPINCFSYNFVCVWLRRTRYQPFNHQVRAIDSSGYGYRIGRAAGGQTRFQRRRVYE